MLFEFGVLGTFVLLDAPPLNPELDVELLCELGLVLEFDEFVVPLGVCLPLDPPLKPLEDGDAGEFELDPLEL
ncbi:hypothetical protein LJK88_20910 [Paenibacillus sp. P26]|nr:hypothetical protein LJK88_20910 [Paenibacillus sp. P26]UUZ95912.1 hypothetical protein LJK87_16950 [Paenibacillus sp. P25]